MGFDVRDIGHPNCVRSINLELPVERVVGDDRRSATISTRAAFVANLCRYAQLKLANRATRFSEQISP